MKIAGVALIMATMLPAVAQDNQSATTAVPDRDRNLTFMTSKGWEWELNAGLNIGGATPLGMPREVRKVRTYNPKLNGSLEGKATKWWGADRRWGTSVGVKFETKAMKVDGDVKSYHTEIIRDADRVSGYWTGFVDIDYDETFFTVPVTVDYRINNRWKVNAGVFFSVRTDGSFSGYVKDGYLRSGNPTGEKIVYSANQRAAYEFDDDLRRTMWGVQLGGSWRAYRHFSVNGELSYSFNNIFRSGFNTVEESLHPLYFNIGFGYTF